MAVRRGIADWKLGTSTSIFPDVDVADLEQLRTLGITHLEVVVSRLERAAELTSLVEAAIGLGMVIHSVHLPYGRLVDVSHPDGAIRRRAIRYERETLDAVAHWRPSVAVIHPSSEPIDPVEREVRLQYCRDSMAELSEAARDVGIQLCVECLPRTCLGNSSDEILRLQEGIADLAVCCDVNHLTRETPQQFIERVGDRIKAVHISDNDGQDERHWVPGKGTITWPQVLAALVQIGYGGPCMFEARSRRGEPRIDPHDLIDWWERMNALFDGTDVCAALPMTPETH